MDINVYLQDSLNDMKMGKRLGTFSQMIGQLITSKPHLMNVVFEQ